MKLTALRTLVKEELKRTLSEDYQDKFKMVGTLITNLEQRPQKEIYSDIRSITGVSVISSKEPLEYSEQDTTKFQSHTGWKPEYTFEQTMNDLLQYWRDRVNSGRKFLRR